MRWVWSLAVGLGTLGCTPEVDPPWLIRRPTELALRTEVVEQGPWGDRQPDETPRKFYDALPGDTLRFTPLIVDEGGPIPPEELSARWVLCPANECLDALARSDQLDPCTSVGPYTEVATCTPGTGPTLEYLLGPAPQDVDEASLFALAVGPNVAFIASRNDEPGARSCAIALRERTDLEGCVIMLRSVAIGPASALLEAAEALGIQVEVSPSLAPLLAVPRNRNPSVERFEVRGSSVSADVQTVSSGGLVQVQAGDELTVRWLPDGEDFDNYEIDVSGDTLLVQEVVTGKFSYDRPTTVFDQGTRSVTLRAEGDAGRANLYFVAMDGGGSETWGQLVLDISEG